MTANKGVVVRGPIVPPDSADVFPTHDAKWGKGGHRSVASMAERDAIPDERRTEGMAVWVTADNTYWQLRGGIDNADWVHISPSMAAAAYQPDSTAGNTAALVTDFNALLAKLRAAGLMDAS